MNEVYMRAWKLAVGFGLLLMQGCGAAAGPYETGSGAGPARAKPACDAGIEACEAELLAREAELQRVLPLLGGAQQLGPGAPSDPDASSAAAAPDCDAARGLRDRICDLAAAICALAARNAALELKCSSAQASCTQARDDVARACE